MDQLMDTEQGHAMMHDPNNMDVKVKVGWVKGLNRLYFLYEAYDNYWDFARNDLHNDIFEVVVDADLSGGPLIDIYHRDVWTPEAVGQARSTIDPRISQAEAHWATHGVHAQNYHIFTPPGDKDWAMAWGCAQYIKRLPYANHAFEFRAIGSSTPWELITGQTDKGLVGFELDIFWLSVAGHDPVDMLKRYAGRVPLLHVKNKPEGIPVQFNETVPAGAFREVGNGVLNIAGILGAATDNGVKHFFVEQDQTPGNPVGSLRQSYDYLRKLTF
jgi:hypothetical protein